MLPHEQAKREMKRRGHSVRSAAKAMGKSYPWVCDVLNGKETSQPVLDAIYRLPYRNPPKHVRSRWYPNLAKEAVAK